MLIAVFTSVYRCCRTSRITLAWPSTPKVGIGFPVFASSAKMNEPPAVYHTPSAYATSRLRQTEPSRDCGHGDADGSQQMRTFHGVSLAAGRSPLFGLSGAGLGARIRHESVAVGHDDLRQARRIDHLIVPDDAVHVEDVGDGRIHL